MTESSERPDEDGGDGERSLPLLAPHHAVRLAALAAAIAALIALWRCG